MKYIHLLLPLTLAHLPSLPRENTFSVYLQIRSQFDFRRSKSKRRQGLVTLNKKAAAFYYGRSPSLTVHFKAPLFISDALLLLRAKWQVEEFAPSYQVTAQMPQPNAAHSSPLPLLCFLLLDCPRLKIVSQSRCHWISNFSSMPGFPFCVGDEETVTASQTFFCCLRA